MNILVIDNYDSFTYNLVQYFAELGQEVVVRRNDDITLDEIRALCDRATILRGGRVTGDVDPREHDSHDLARMMIGRDMPPPQHLAPMPAGEVRLEPLEERHRADLREACGEDEAIWQIYALSYDRDHFDQNFTQLLAGTNLVVVPQKNGGYALQVVTLVDGERALAIDVVKTQGANTIQVARGVRSAVAELQAAVGRRRHVDRGANARVEGGFFVADSGGFCIGDAHAAVARQGNFSGSEASGANQHGGGEKNLFHRFPSLS